jgi:predicted HTH domain antitoxin
MRSLQELVVSMFNTSLIIVTFISYRVASFVTVNKLQTITTRVPDEIYQDIKRIESEEKAERAEVIRRLLDEAIKRRKLKRAMDAMREGKMTLRSAAKSAGLTYVEMMDEVEKAGIPMDYTMADLQLDLDAIKKKEE